MPCGSKPGSAATAKRLEGLLKICTGAVPPGASPWRSALEIFVISAEKSCVDPLPALRSVPSPRLASQDAKERWAKGKSPPCGPGMPATGSPRLPCTRLLSAPLLRVEIEVAAAPSPMRRGRGGGVGEPEEAPEAPGGSRILWAAAWF